MNITGGWMKIVECLRTKEKTPKSQCKSEQSKMRWKTLELRTVATAMNQCKKSEKSLEPISPT